MTLPPSCAVVVKSGDLNFLELSGPLQACNGTALPFIILLGTCSDTNSIYVLPQHHTRTKAGKIVVCIFQNFTFLEIVQKHKIF